MKIRSFLSYSLSIAAVSLAAPVAVANLAPTPVEMHTNLFHEEVTCHIQGDEAVVTGTFTFNADNGFYVDPMLYLPVYAVEGTPVKQMKPEVSVGDKPLEVTFVKKEWEDSREIKGFGKLPELEGQRVYWFVFPHLPVNRGLTAGPEQPKLTLKIRYTQELSGNKFIYTPLIPKQKKGKDYGSITVSADRALTLIDSDKHTFVEENGMFVVDPSHKRAIVVSVAKPAPKIP